MSDLESEVEEAWVQYSVKRVGDHVLVWAESEGIRLLSPFTPAQALELADLLTSEATGATSEEP